MLQIGKDLTTDPLRAKLADPEKYGPNALKAKSAPYAPEGAP